MTAEAEVAAWLAAQADKVVETTLARVFLTPAAAFKQKRTVRYSYVDFSSDEKRWAAVARELELNRATAPDLYRRVRRVSRAAGGGLEFDGPGERLDEVIEMRRFADEAVLAARPERLDGAIAEALGRMIADVHADAPLRPAVGLDFTVPSNAGLLTELAPQLGESAVAELVAATDAEHRRLGPLLAERAAQGFARRCHGDLHLGNILLEGERPMLFDCIEFNEDLSNIDVLYDLAFLLMDLTFRGRHEAAVRVLSGYLDQAARRFPDALWDGVAALPLMMSVRAAVRTHVSAHAGDLDLARRYLTAASAHLRPAPPRLMAIGGRSGGGKSSLARRAAPNLGAVILRSDEVRKRLAGLAPSETAPPEAYAPTADAAAYDALFGAARRLLAAGRAVVLDATFLRPELRARAEATAAQAGVPFEGIWLEAPLEVLEPRVIGRRGDVSDAGPEVLRAQMELDVGVVSWRRLDAGQTIDALAAAVSGAGRSHTR